MQNTKRYLSKWPKFGVFWPQSGRHCCLANENGALLAADYDPFTGEVLATSSPASDEFAPLVFGHEPEKTPEIGVVAPPPRSPR